LNSDGAEKTGQDQGQRKAGQKGLAGRMASPVCLGVKMEKVRLGSNPHIELDVCRRCGGMWFDAGEVARLRRLKPQALWTHVEANADEFRMKCHDCAATLKRNDEKCLACGWVNTLACPACRRGLTRVVQDGLAIDVCRRCRGAWFDNVELASVWNRQVTAFERRPGAKQAGMSDDSLVLHALIWTDPTVMYLGAHAVANAAPLAGAVLENTGELAGSVFGALGDLIAKVFEALGDLT
jgi:Zn-finger nucleic acid-binding protein